VHNVLTCVNCEVTLEVIMIPELPITKWTQTALSIFVIRFAVELASVWIICLDIQPLSHQIQSIYLAFCIYSATFILQQVYYHFIHTYTDQQASDEGLCYNTKFWHGEHSICWNRFQIQRFYAFDLRIWNWFRENIKTCSGDNFTIEWGTVHLFMLIAMDKIMIYY